MSWLSNNECVIVEAAAAAGTTDLTTDGVDCSGCTGVVFLVDFGAITANAVTSIHAEQSDDDSSYADLEDSNITVADDEDSTGFVVEVKKPKDKYVRLIIDRGTENAVVGAIWAVKYGLSTSPGTQDATTITDTEAHVSPDEGTI